MKMGREFTQIRQQFLKIEHPDTLNNLYNLAIVLDKQGKYDEAEKMCRQTLQLSEKVLGNKHPDTFDSMNNLAVVLYRQ
jgi:tetratricopeptide (TPR) repeat protein